MATITPIAVAVVEHASQFLVGLRPPGVPLGGYWEFPGGKIRPGETPQAAAARECLEETGLQVEIEKSYLRHVHEYDHGTVDLHFFAATPTEPHQPPTEPFRWVAREQLTQLPFPSGNAELMALLTLESTL